MACAEPPTETPRTASVAEATDSMSVNIRIDAAGLTEAMMQNHPFVKIPWRTFFPNLCYLCGQSKKEHPK